MKITKGNPTFNYNINPKGLEIFHINIFYNTLNLLKNFI